MQSKAIRPFSRKQVTRVPMRHSGRNGHQIAPDSTSDCAGRDMSEKNGVTFTLVRDLPCF